MARKRIEVPTHLPPAPTYAGSYQTPYKPVEDSYRARWYAERGLPYEPAKLTDCPPFRCMGGSATKLLRQREPGDDDVEIAA